MDAIWQQLVAVLQSLGMHSVVGASAHAVQSGAAQMSLPQLLALAAALGWASGFRLYAVVFLVGLSGAAGWISLPTGLHRLQHPVMLTASGVMLFLEFFADKIPGVDALWDIVHSVIRIPAGAALAVGVLGADSATATALVALLGGTLAASSQAAKTTTRAAINTLPEPFTNIAASLLEDGLAAGALWLATQHPLAFAVCLVITVTLLGWITLVLFKFLRAALWRIVAFFAGSSNRAQRV